MSTRFATALGAVALLATALAGSAHAHEGHDHGAPPPPVSRTIAPRGEALSDAFELVAIARDGTLTLLLDRFRTNEPVIGASIEVETPEGPQTAAATPDGGYALPAPWLSKPGRHELVATVTAGDAVDVLVLAVTVPNPKGHDAAHATSSPATSAESVIARISESTRGVRELLGQKNPTLLVAIAVAFLLGMLVMAVVRGRRSGRQWRCWPSASPWSSVPPPSRTATRTMARPCWARRLPSRGAPPTPTWRGACPTARSSYPSRPSAYWSCARP